MGVGAGFYMYDVVVKKFTFTISSPDEFLSVKGMLLITYHIWQTFTENIICICMFLLNHSLKVDTSAQSLVNPALEIAFTVFCMYRVSYFVSEQSQL